MLLLLLLQIRTQPHLNVVWCKTMWAIASAVQVHAAARLLAQNEDLRDTLRKTQQLAATGSRWAGAADASEYWT
jgi:hypothetical protein